VEIDRASSKPLRLVAVRTKHLGERDFARDQSGAAKATASRAIETRPCPAYLLVSRKRTYISTTSRITFEKKSDRYAVEQE